MNTPLDVGLIAEPISVASRSEYAESRPFVGYRAQILAVHLAATHNLMERLGTAFDEYVNLRLEGEHNGDALLWAFCNMLTDIGPEGTSVAYDWRSRRFVCTRPGGHRYPSSTLGPLHINQEE